MESGKTEGCDGGTQMKARMGSKEGGSLRQIKKERPGGCSFVRVQARVAGGLIEKLAQIGGGGLHFQLEGGVAGHVEGLTLLIGVPFVFVGQLDGQRTLDHRHPLGGGGIELVVTGFHHTHGGFVAFLLETDGFYISIKILVNFQHVFIPVCTFAQPK